MLKKILLIEDNEGDSRLLQELLFDAHPGRYEISSAFTLQEGLTYLNSGEFDAVLTDLDLPDSDKTNTVTYIQNKNPVVPVIVLSGCESEKIAREIVQMGAQDYLIKGQGDGYLISRAIEYSIERKRNEQGLHNLAHYDHLTGLANRLLFRERLDRALIRADRHKTIVALFVIDLDRFKQINDTLGHHFGDKVLIEISARLQALLRKSDTVARLGGDEFAILLPKTSQYQIKYVAEKITESIEQQIQLGAHKFYVSSSLGIAMYPNDGEDYQTLIQRADVAMYISKRSSLNFAFYEQSQDTHSVEKLALISDLHKAIESDELELFYQPKLDLVAQSASSAEALLRWRHPERGFISPEEIIEIAERTGIIKPLTCFVINKALQQSAQWSSVGIEVIISVNLSVWNLQDRSFIGQVQQALQKWQVDCEKVTFEITESAMMADPERALATLCALDDMGIGLSIDDFGTGFSSLSYLKKLPVDELKIDKSFVMNMIEDKDDATIVHSTIELAHNLHLKVVAEGVETQQILTRLTELGCDWIQGYYLSRPMPVADFTQWYLSEAPQNKDTPKQDASRESV